MALTLLWFVLCTAAAVIAEELVNCTVDETPVPEGSFVSIKCKFTFDIAEKRENFSVSRTDTTGVTISVVDCKWNSSTGNHTCLDKGTEYQVQSITSEVRILILRATTMHTGNYTCHVANRTILANPCTLVVTEVPFKTSCSAPKVREGSTAEVICEFNKNLKQLKAEFLVIKQPLLARGYDNESAVIDCFWKGDKPECKNQEGYTIDESAVTSTFILRISSTSSEQEGRYTCRAHSSLQPDETSCKFEFLHSKQDLTSSTPETFTNTGQTTDDFHKSTHALAGTILGFELLCIVVAAYCCWMRRKDIFRRQEH